MLLLILMWCQAQPLGPPPGLTFTCHKNRWRLVQLVAPAERRGLKATSASSEKQSAPVQPPPVYFWKHPGCDRAAARCRAPRSLLNITSPCLIYILQKGNEGIHLFVLCFRQHPKPERLRPFEKTRGPGFVRLEIQLASSQF